MADIKMDFSSKKTVKFCTSCKTWLDIGKYDKNSCKPDKVQTYCRTCAKEHVKKSVKKYDLKKIAITLSVDDHKKIMDFCKKNKFTASEWVRDIIKSLDA